MLIIPLPTFLLDFLLAISIMSGLLILMIVMFIGRTFDFSMFPSLLLITTVFRLALNVSSTRLILLQGAAFDGKIIRAFGEFVVGGNYVVGFIIFIILVAVQFIVITKGATRTAEVAARFTLDAMPGKQMSIDSDLSNGLITEDEARKRREEIRKEADFYGAMDGASKFVQGDVKVAIVITFINIIGGFIIGMVMRGESFDVAHQDLHPADHRRGPGGADPVPAHHHGDRYHRDPGRLARTTWARTWRTSSGRSRGRS